MNVNSAPDILGMLHHDQVRSNIQQMYAIGIDMRQESAFAVYEPDEVSELYVPEVQPKDTSFLEAARNATRIDLTPLATDKRHVGDYNELETAEAKITDDLLEGVGEAHLQEMKPAIAHKIAHILSSAELDFDQKDSLISKLVQKDQESRTSVWRSDIKLMVHNHVSLHTLVRAAVEMALPSQPDLEVHEQLRQENPGMVSMIVAPTIKEKKAILYGVPNGTEPELSRYDNVGNGSPQKVLDKLEATGFVHTVIDLASTGRLRRGADKVREFSEKLVA